MSNLTDFNFNLFLDKKREQFKTSGRVLWFFGLSGSGKSTLANALSEKIVAEHNYFPILLDGDNVRQGLNSDLGFEQKDRTENLRRVANVAKILAAQGQVVLCTFITPLNDQRELIQDILGDSVQFIYTDASFDICEQRDPKGLYQKARAGEIPNFTGRESLFEEPKSKKVNILLNIRTDERDLEDSVKELFIAYTDTF